jgi:two-component system, OmpR family, sensor histidine kinase KdpD
MVKVWIYPFRNLVALWRYSAAFAVLGLLTYCGVVLHVTLPTISLIYLLLVVTVALLWGFLLASFTSCIAVVCLDYFFTLPVYSFRISDANDYVALVAFEATALVISNLSSRALQHAREAAVERANMERLYELSRSSLLLDLNKAPGPELAVLIHKIFDLRAVALFDAYTGHLASVGDWKAGEEQVAMECFLQGTAIDDLQAQSMQRIMRVGNHPVGALVLRDKVSPLIMNALASLSVIAMERYQITQKENKAESAKQSEQLRTAVLDALAHDFKTPLTAIQAVSSSLIEMEGLTLPQREMVALIDNEASFLNELCTRLLRTAKLDAEQFDTQKEDVNVHELILEVLANRASHEERNTIEIVVDVQSSTVRVNRGLVAMILSQYIDNARKYSTPGTPIKITVRKSPSDLLVSVHNFGSTVRMEDRDLIFERFYRSPESKDAITGTGIGLSAVKKAAEANHAHVWVISDENEETTFFLSIPDRDRSRN